MQKEEEEMFRFGAIFEAKEKVTMQQEISLQRRGKRIVSSTKVLTAAEGIFRR